MKRKLINIVKKFLAYFGVSIKPRLVKPLFGDSMTTTTIGSYTIDINKMHALRFMKEHHPTINMNLGRIAGIVVKHYPDAVAVDIGANIGDTVAYIKNVVDMPIICIEGDDAYHKILTKNVAQFKNVEIYKTFLGDVPSTTTAVVAIQNGTARIKTDIKSNEKGTKSITIDTLDNTLVKHNAKTENVKLIKIDTDGYDVKIIRGAKEHLKKVKPVLFFEYDYHYLDMTNEKGLDTLAMLSSIGYSDVLFYDNYGRFILSMKLSHVSMITQLHNYIHKYKAPFTYYDLCVFHEDDANMAAEFIKSETALQLTS